MAFRSSTGFTPGSGNSLAINVPAGAAIDDIAVVGIYKENDRAITPPAGFTQKAALATSASARGSLYVFWKRLDAADTGTYTFTWGAGGVWRSAACALFSGRITTGDPFDGTVGTAESTTAVSTLNVSTSPAAAGGDAVDFHTNFQGGNAYTAPTDYTERQDLDVIGMFTRDAVASGSTGNVTATSNVSGFQKAFLGVLAVAAAGGTTGSLAETQDIQTLAASGQIGYTSSLAVTQAEQTPAASGQIGYSGSLSQTQDDQTLVASGTSGTTVTGTLAITQNAQILAASGHLTLTSSIAVTQADQTLAATGTVGDVVAGSVAQTQDAQTLSTSGQIGYTGLLAETQVDQTINASGTTTENITGSLATTQDPQTLAASGTIGLTGSFTVTQADQTLSASGAVGVATHIAQATGQFQTADIVPGGMGIFILAAIPGQRADGTYTSIVTADGSS